MSGQPDVKLRWFLIIVMVSSAFADDSFLYDTFPAGFRWGTATASYQVEGAWDRDGKGESIWDRFCHTGGRVMNNDTGDVADNSYYKYNDDIAILKNLGVHFYRFSISWPRILPNGTMELVNEAGINYYNRLIDGLLAKGIEPMATIFHWDLPQALEDIGGWLNPDIVQYFNDYAKLCYQRFGDRVKLWLTINEPYIFSYHGYGTGILAPGYRIPDVGPYQAGHNLIKAHAEAWHTYDNEFRQKQKGKVSLPLVSHWFEPISSKTEDIVAAERAMQFLLGWFANPIFDNGDYPEVMKVYVGRKSSLEGLNASRLPEFTATEKARIAGTHDFFALNLYTGLLVENSDRSQENSSWDSDSDVKTHIDPTWPRTGTGWFFEVPWSIRKALVWIKNHYNNPEVYITENGVSDDKEHFGSLEDQQRIRFLTNYINNVLKAIKLDKCNVVGYALWSLMDNFEWMDGYQTKFGLHRVNFSDPTRARVPKKSVAFYKQLIVNNGWSTASNSHHNYNHLHSMMLIIPIIYSICCM